MKWNPSDAQGDQGVGVTKILVAKLGHIFREQQHSDTGIDTHVELVEQDTREATGEIVALQVKGGPSYFKELTSTGVIYPGSLEHLDYWLNHRLPVFLVLVETAKHNEDFRKGLEKQFGKSRADKLFSEHDAASEK